MFTLLMLSMSRSPSRPAPGAVSRTLAGAGVAVGLLAAGAAAPAQAQGFGGFFGPRTMVIEEPSPAIPAPEVYRRLLNRGYQLNSAMQRNGGVYLADVVDSRGVQQRLVIDAYRGRILQAFAYGPPRPAGLVPRQDGLGTGPTYASREPMAPPSALPGQDPRDPRVIPGLGPQRRAEPKVKHRAKTATREVAPKEAPVATPAPSRATKAPPAPAPAQAATPPAPSESVTTASVPAKAAVEPAPSAAPAPAPKPAPATASAAPAIVAPVARPAAAPAPVAPAAKSENKPGYANGVPINPLD